MSNKISLIKAQYCWAVLRTAYIVHEGDARKLLMDLATEQPTPDTSDNVANAEAAALEMIYALAKQAEARSGSFTATDLAKAQPVMENWINAAR